MRLLVTIGWVMFLALSASAEQNVNPDINRNYQNPNVTQWRGVFERDGREVWDRRDDIIRQLRLKPGQKIADVGAGTGFFTLMMAQAVGPTGKVYAVDIAKNFVDASVQRAKDHGLQNVAGVVNDAHSVRLPANAVDLVFTSDTYHHFEYPQSTLASIHSALVPGGEMVVIDFKRVPGISNPWVLQHVRAGEATVTAEIESAGFELVERLDFMQTQYFLRFRKR
ncbi:class I SAM-dependent methyltransferase [Thiosocius teredinicola]|uniref:class I SAM-dependent methyltransferase n=1 Tax=Thiosocius teredinicola TaxID=1973002 RepID=UPI000990E761